MSRKSRILISETVQNAKHHNSHNIYLDLNVRDYLQKEKGVLGFELNDRLCLKD